MFYVESCGNFAMVTQSSTGCTRCPGLAANQRRDDRIYRNDISELYNDVQELCYYGIGSCSLWKQCLTGARHQFGESLHNVYHKSIRFADQNKSPGLLRIKESTHQ